MLLEKIKTPGLSHLSYLIGSQGKAAVIDPRRDCECYVEMARANGTALVTTLTANDRIAQIARAPGSLASREDLTVLPPEFYEFSVRRNPYAAQASEGYIAYAESIVAFNAPLVRAFADAGIAILTGTDAGIPGVAPGFSLHDEFEALAAAVWREVAWLRAGDRRGGLQSPVSSPQSNCGGTAAYTQAHC